MSTSADEIVLEARRITKRYPGTVALDDVTFRVYTNQVNVLIGENGAGKSTLMRILAGVETADEGELLLDGKPILVRSPREAAAHWESRLCTRSSRCSPISTSREYLCRARTGEGEDSCSIAPRRHARAPMALRRLDEADAGAHARRRTFARAAVRLSRWRGRSTRERGS